MLVLVFTLSFSFEATAQTEPEKFTAKNALYLEIGGSSGIYAINYSKIFCQSGKLKLNASAGFSMWPNETIDSKTIWLPAIPLEITALYGKSSHHLEMGLGFTSFLEKLAELDSNTMASGDKVYFGAAIPLRLGYRYQKPGGGFFYRVAYTPAFVLPTGERENWVFEPIMAGLSIGKSF